MRIRIIVYQGMDGNYYVTAKPAGFWGIFMDIVPYGPYSKKKANENANGFIKEKVKRDNRGCSLTIEEA